ncbi:PD-(D/E)XK motif protein [Gulosibacter molinativorax]|uniref:PD-(D/E)XK motif protein n=1 Tax=Gulosibacter molinativorax TaxID=256821 RepID=A0ABT7CD28_9MICO|nr:PD-(D/E)XK motif protein [Gulosibacter molinativorax]MDJ1372614.1 PD-(D/E)XK motif protein [Gulosibacter molinativorax]QUY62277.1 Hypotetical protein [Gulosibacter molinativorax]
MTENADQDPTHLDPSTIEEYFKFGESTAFPVFPSAEIRMRIVPAEEAIELTVPAVGAEPEVTRFEKLTIGRYTQSGREWFRLTVDATGMHYEAYVLVEAIVEQMRAGATFRLSVSEALSSFKDLLSNRQRLTDEKELGLIGELLVLQHVLAEIGEEEALVSWLGPRAEEHDFGFADFDAEIKTTKSESRTHLIGSESQLEPSRDRPLFLVSIQLTLAGGASRAITLPSLIADIRSRLEFGLRSFDATMECIGWRQADADLYPRRFQLRSEPRAYLVDDQFPAITSGRLDQVVPNRANVVGVTYRVNVSNLNYSAVHSPLDTFCEAPA